MTDLKDKKDNLAENVKVVYDDYDVDSTDIESVNGFLNYELFNTEVCPDEYQVKKVPEDYVLVNQTDMTNCLDFGSKIKPVFEKFNNVVHIRELQFSRNLHICTIVHI